jgi:hypothetical protein
MAYVALAYLTSNCRQAGRIPGFGFPYCETGHRFAEFRSIAAKMWLGSQKVP